MDSLNNKEILITGGTGSLGNALIDALIRLNIKPHGVRIFSRGEKLQWDMKHKYKDVPFPISFIIGDVRDAERLEVAMKRVDYVIHAAAMKQVPTCEDNPKEAIDTNVIGTGNVIMAAIKNDVKKALLISTDKAVYPINLYGMTKGCAEKLFLNASVYNGGRTDFAIVRYGNVLGSRGSVIELFKKQKEQGLPLTITDPEMTRFWIRLDKVAEFILDTLCVMKNKSLHIPKMTSAKMDNIAAAFYPDSSMRIIIGRRQGEKIHECIMTKEEVQLCQERQTCFEIYPDNEIIDKDNLDELTSLNNKALINDKGLILRLYGLEGE